MLNTLANHNDDIRRLLEKGYAISIDSGYLVIRDIPYLDNTGALKTGAIVSKLVFVTQDKVQLEDHQIFFCGSLPHQIDGSAIRNLGGGLTNLRLSSSDVIVERSFSSRPTSGYADLFEKIETYVNIISGPAMALHDVNPLTFRTVDTVSNSVFKVHDTLTSRAEIGDLNALLENDTIAIIGLGGTGSYILDYLVKTPVKEIRGFDSDYFHVHNAFRSPGKLDLAELGRHKAEVYQKRYEEFRNGIDLRPNAVLADSVDDLSGVSFAFVCVDKGTSRAAIFNLLITMKIPFIDVGIGLERIKGLLSGTLRTTYFSGDKAEETQNKKLAPLNDPPDDIYRNNIQVAELNALNASIAVIRYKQLRRFYNADGDATQILFTIDNLSCIWE